MQHLILIALGGAAGSVLRYGVCTTAYHYFGRNFPYGTLVVNAFGSLLMGFLSSLLLERLSGLTPEVKGLLLIGFLGGFTTFSAFSFETLELFEKGMVKHGALNIISSVIVCLFLVWVGAILGRKI